MLRGRTSTRKQALGKLVSKALLVSKEFHLTVEPFRRFF
jgi:hypothetical protein